jgi:hypothetical protein
MGKVWLKIKKERHCDSCFFLCDDGECDAYKTEVSCDGFNFKFIQITESEFNATQGKKYKIKGGERVDI